MPPELILTRSGQSGPRLLFIEPYLNSSHNALAKGLMQNLPGRWTLLGLAGRHFRWRMRGAASYMALAAAHELAKPWDALLCSSMLDLAGLRGLCPALARVPALIYFHENQLAYPFAGRADANQKERDLYLAFANLAGAQAAKRVVFNSAYHQRAFMAAAFDLLDRLPDCKPPGLVEGLAAKSAVLPVPLEVRGTAGLAREPRSGPLRILWNHRWADDKDPQAFFEALSALAGQGLEFLVAVLGQSAAQPPPVFKAAAQELGTRVVRFGAVEKRRDYWGWLFWADLAVSCARQEFMGLALAEAAWAGCRPLAPNELAYPELYPSEYLYERGRLPQALAGFVADPALARVGGMRELVSHLTWENQRAAWQKEIAALSA